MRFNLNLLFRVHHTINLSFRQRRLGNKTVTFWKTTACRAELSKAYQEQQKLLLGVLAAMNGQPKAEQKKMYQQMRLLTGLRELGAADWSDSCVNNRIALLVCLDTAMLLLVCVLEPIQLTGLELHQWLGFALCPLVLLHVVLQWPWLVTQFQRLRVPGAFRVRINTLLNLTLFVLMASVLFSGVFASRQSTTLIGDSLGRVRLWHEVHGWLNFVLVVFVSLHLALNWDWLLTALRRRRPGRPALADTAWERRPLSPGNPLGRGFVVLLLAAVAAGAVYFAMEAMLPMGERAKLRHQPVITATAERSQKAQLAPQPRPAQLTDGTSNLSITVAATMFVVVIGRYVFRLRL
jgi:cytochrome b561